MAEMTDQTAQQLTTAIQDMSTKLGSAKTTGTQAGGGKGISGGAPAVASALIRLHDTIGDSSKALSQPFTLTGQALTDLAGILNAVTPEMLPFGKELGSFVNIIAQGGAVLAKHNQELLDFSQGLAGSAGLSINSFTELTNQLSTANLGMADFQRIQAESATFLSSMGGELRGASGQARLLADVTNIVNDDFEKLGQAGLSLAEKQTLQGESMDMLRQIGLEQGTTSQQAAALVSGAMQNMAMESNKMAALTGADRRKTLAAMAEKLKSDADVKITAKLLSDQQGHTAEQTAKTRQSLVNIDGVLGALGPTGVKLQQAMTKAAETGQPFSLMLAKMHPQLFAMVSKNQEYMDGMETIVGKVRKGETVEVEDIGAAQKKLEGSMNKNMAQSALLSDAMAQEYRDLTLATVNANAFAADAAKNVEIETAKLKDGSAGQAANMAQVLKDGLTQAKNISDVVKTMATEIFNQKFADDGKTIRDGIKEHGTAIIGGVSNARDVMMGVRSYNADTTKEMRELLGTQMAYSEDQVAAAHEQLSSALEMVGLTEKQKNAIAEAAGISGTLAQLISAQQSKSLDTSTAVTAKAQEMLDNVSEMGEITQPQIAEAADALGVGVQELVTALERLRTSNEESVNMSGSTVNSLANRLQSMTAGQQTNFEQQMKDITGLGSMADEKYDQLIQGVIDNKTIELGDASRELFKNIQSSDQSQKIIDLLSTMGSGPGLNTENDRLAIAIDALVEVLKNGSNKPAPRTGQIDEGAAEIIGKGLDRLGKNLTTLFD